MPWWAMTGITHPYPFRRRRIESMKSLWKWILAVVVIAAAAYGIRQLLDET